MAHTSARRAFIVLDLGFGDSGKGLLTDYLVRATGARRVVRYNGGAQAGHNVVTPDGRHHTFAQLGAGSFVPGTLTLLSRFMVVHPTALLLEAELLGRRGVPDALERVKISERARLITPYHQAANRLRELARGEARHGSCGVGVGEVVEDEQACPEDVLRAGDLRAPSLALAKLDRIRERSWSKVKDLLGERPLGAAAARELEVFEQPELRDRWLQAVLPLITRDRIVPDELLTRWMAADGATVFEGAQGVLLDQVHGFHPYTTWSCCTAENALELLEGSRGVEMMKIGVLRAHAVRHGPGPLPTEEPGFGAVLSDDNASNPWQGPVRYGPFDAVLARYALEAAGGVHLLALTHLDGVQRAGRWRYCDRYRWASTRTPFPLERDASGAVIRVAACAAATPEQRLALTEDLSSAAPILSEVRPTQLLEAAGELLGMKVGATSDGPRSQDLMAHDPSFQLLADV